MVQLEAMLCGRPVVSTDLPTGVPWVNVHGETGLSCPAGDAPALRRRVERLVADGDLRRALGAAARASPEHVHGRQHVRGGPALYTSLCAPGAWPSTRQPDRMAGPYGGRPLMKPAQWPRRPRGQAVSSCLHRNPRPWRGLMLDDVPFASITHAPSVLETKTRGCGIPAPPHSPAPRSGTSARTWVCMPFSRRWVGLKVECSPFEPNPERPHLTENVRLNGLKIGSKLYRGRRKTSGDANLYVRGADGMSRIGRANPVLDRPGRRSSR